MRKGGGSCGLPGSRSPTKNKSLERVVFQKMSIIQVTGGSGGGVPADRTLFIGPRIPQEVKTMGKHLDKIDKQTFRKLLQGKV